MGCVRPVTIVAKFNHFTMHHRTSLFSSTLLLLCAATLTACQDSAPPATDAADVQADTVATAPTSSARPVHWSYEGEAGPMNWGALSPVYALCKDGVGQSPIALTSGAAGTGGTWKFNYGSTGLTLAHHEHVDELVDNGHTIQVNVEEGSTLTLNGKVYTLKQFHFHTPSEHTLDGKNLPMEMHMVHQDSAGGFAVVSVLFEEGRPNANIAKLVANLPAAKGDTVSVANERMDLELHLPSTERAFHYVGSLTTPPCSEQVEWLVLQDRITASKEQIAAFATRIGPNNRPVQDLHTREVSTVVLSGSTN
jgi:carbonic anhydrase